MSISSQEKSDPRSKEEIEKKIDVLLKKEASGELSLDEYLLLADTYSTVDNPYQSLIILDKLINELIQPDSENLLAIAYNRKAENLVDLSKIDEGVALCDEMIPLLEKNDKMLYEAFCVKCGIFYNRSLDYDKAYTIYNKVKEQKLKKSPVFINNYKKKLKY